MAHFSEDRHDGNLIVGPPDNWHIAAVWHQHSHGRSIEECDANARLIAAAPELLATLKGILTYIEDGNVVELRPCGFVAEVRAAIAKAEGSAS